MLRSDDFQFVASFLRLHSGLVASEDHYYLLEARLLPVARQFNLEGLEDIIRKLRAMSDPALQKAVIEAMLSFESSFFRGKKFFDRLKTGILPELLEKRANTRRFRLWSAGCGKGQEIYSIAMILDEMADRLKGWSVELVASDLSLQSVEAARKGIFNHFEAQEGLSARLLIKYFDKADDGWQIHQGLRDKIEFKVFNQLHDTLSMDMFDIVLCRNVLKYFDVPTKARALENLGRVIAPDGLLVLGDQETVSGLTDKFQLLDGDLALYGLSGSTYSKTRLAAAG